MIIIFRRFYYHLLISELQYFFCTQTQKKTTTTFNEKHIAVYTRTSKWEMINIILYIYRDYSLSALILCLYPDQTRPDRIIKMILFYNITDDEYFDDNHNWYTTSEWAVPDVTEGGLKTEIRFWIAKRWQQDAATATSMAHEICINFIDKLF